jgi:hypothetical protein
MSADPIHIASPNETSPVRAVTARSLTASLVIIVISVVWDEWMSYYMSGSNISRSHFPLAFLLPYLCLCILNMFGRRLYPSVALSRPELMVVLATGLVAISVPYDGLTGQMVSIIASPFYFATPENRWSIYVHEYIPSWLVARNNQDEMGWFFEGVPAGQVPDLAVWVTPLFWWTCLVAALAFGVFCVVVMLRKQWSDHERLAYPLVEAGGLLADTEVGGRLEQQLKSPLFWIAFGAVMTIKMWNVATYFTPALPFISIEGGQFRAFPDFPMLITRVSFYGIGFGYFARLDVLFSVWFFILVTAFQVYVFNKFGHKLGSSPTQWGSQAVGYQSLGAMLFMAVWSVWMARRHLRDVWAKAFGKDASIDDSEELVSYRTAVFGLLGSLVFSGAWLTVAGMELWVVCIYLPLAFLTFLGLSRVISELGLVYVYYRVQPSEFVLKVLGGRILGQASVVILYLTRSIQGIGKGFVMPALTQAVKAADGVVKPKRIALVIWLALGVGYTVSIVDTIYLGYDQGAYNLGNMGLRKVGPQSFNQAVSAFLNPTPFGGKGRATWVAVGAVVMAALTLVRYRITGWPIHPIGLALQGSYGLTKTWMSIFMAWGIKGILMRIGGQALYERGKPFFVGLITAQAVSTAIVFVVDWFFFEGRGHNVHNY